MRYFCEHAQGKHYAIIDDDEGGSDVREAPTKFEAMGLRDRARNANVANFGELDAGVTRGTEPAPVTDPEPLTADLMAALVDASPNVGLAVAETGDPAVQAQGAAAIEAALSEGQPATGNWPDQAGDPNVAMPPPNDPAPAAPVAKTVEQMTDEELAAELQPDADPLAVTADEVADANAAPPK